MARALIHTTYAHGTHTTTCGPKDDHGAAYARMVGKPGAAVVVCSIWDTAKLVYVVERIWVAKGLPLQRGE